VQKGIITENEFAHDQVLVTGLVLEHAHGIALLLAHHGHWRCRLLLDLQRVVLPSYFAHLALLPQLLHQTVTFLLQVLQKTQDETKINKTRSKWILKMELPLGTST
jgi:hypothetical protein